MIKNLFRTRGLSVLVGLVTLGIAAGILSFQAPETHASELKTFFWRYLLEATAYTCGLVLTNLFITIREARHRRRTKG